MPTFYDKFHGTVARGLHTHQHKPEEDGPFEINLALHRIDYLQENIEIVGVEEIDYPIPLSGVKRVSILRENRGCAYTRNNTLKRPCINSLSLLATIGPLLKSG